MDDHLQYLLDVGYQDPPSTIINQRGPRAFAVAATAPFRMLFSQSWQDPASPRPAGILQPSRKLCSMSTGMAQPAATPAKVHKH